MILDTCALLWLAGGTGRISADTRTAIDQASAVWVSAISAFEISLKTTSGELRLPASPREWWDRALSHHSLSVLPVTDRVCLRAIELPLIHKAPADRFIIASALLEDLPVVTADSRFAAYGVRTMI